MDDEALRRMHVILFEALRHREQEIFRYLAILGPALGGFIWLLYRRAEPFVFTVSTIGILMLLLLGAVYSLALGYNYRYITLEQAKLEARLQIESVMLAGWPRSREDFLKRCSPFRPPEVIAVFWWAFLVGIFVITIAASCFKPETWKSVEVYTVRATVILIGIACLLLGFLRAKHFGRKLRSLCDLEFPPETVGVQGQPQ
jgi:hypothetical protein